MSSNPETEHQVWWARNGYFYGRELDPHSGLWVCVAEMAYTWRLMVCEMDYVHAFWCYPKDMVSLGYVVRAAGSYTGHGDPEPGWIKAVPSERRMPKPEQFLG